MRAHELIKTARHFAENVLAHSALETDKAEGLSKELVNEMGALGLLGAILPEAFGGSGVDAVAYGEITRHIGKACSAARTLMTVHTSLVGETLVRFGTPQQKDYWLTEIAKGSKIACFALSEPNVGSDAKHIQTQYEKTDNNSYIINGQKKWISFAGIADVFLVFANCNGESSAFVVERDMPGVHIERLTGLLAGRGTHLAEITLTNVEVPRVNLVGRESAGFSFIANTALFYGRYSIAWAGLSLIEAALEAMVNYANQREQGGCLLSQHQLIQSLIADATVAFYASDALCKKIANARIENHPHVIEETNITKLYTSQQAMKVCTDAVQLFGANGFSENYPVERLFREAKVLEIIEGSTQIQKQLISNFSIARFRR
jgi:alkylation response protein AidB-like acyl-CoA dehydrogenase